MSLRKYFNYGNNSFNQNELFEMLCESQDDLMKLEAFAANIDKYKLEHWQTLPEKFAKATAILKKEDDTIEDLEIKVRELENEIDRLESALDHSDLEESENHPNCIFAEDQNTLLKVEFLRKVIDNFTLDELEKKLTKIHF